MKKLNVALFLAIFTIGGIGCTGCKKKKEEVKTEKPVENGGNNNFNFTTLEDGSQTFTGNLSSGAIMSDLSWAWNSSMACFVEPVVNQYKGNHVLYQIDLPAHSTLDVYLNATNESQEIALYGYSIGAGKNTTPPNITSCVSCESSPSNNALPKTGEKHIYLNAVTNPYSIILGVAGAEGLTDGEYTVQIVVES